MVENHGELFLRRVYTDREIRFCQSRRHAIEHFAGLWAAKEAILKALGSGWSRGGLVDRHRGPPGEAGPAQGPGRRRGQGVGDPPGDRRHPPLDLALPDLRHRLRDGPRGRGAVATAAGTRGLKPDPGPRRPSGRLRRSGRAASRLRQAERRGGADEHEDDRSRLGHRRGHGLPRLRGRQAAAMPADPARLGDRAGDQRPVERLLADDDGLLRARGTG